MLHYRIGDEIRWGVLDSGKKTDANVAIYGFAGPCPICGKIEDYVVFVGGNIIRSVEPMSEELAVKITNTPDANYYLYE